MFLESAGREDAMAGDTEGAVGLTQILAETGQNLLQMRVDVPRSRRYTRRIRRALLRGRILEVERLRAARRRVDQRFDPAQALAGTARYLKLAKARFHRDDMAFVSLPHGDGQPRERPARLRIRARRRGPLLHAGLLRLHAAAQRRRPAQARLLRRRLLQLPVEARLGARDHAPAPRGRGRARPHAGRADRQGVGRGGAAPARLDAALHARPRSCRRPGTTTRSWRSPTTRA